MIRLSNKTRSLVLSLANVGRAFINPFFIAVISWLFIRQGNKEELLSFNHIIVILNAALVFTAWGLKDYLLKAYVKDNNTFNEKFRVSLFIKFCLCAIAFMVCVFCVEGKIVQLLGALLFVRTMNQHFEVPLAFNNKNILVFSVELMGTIVVLVLTYLGKIANAFTLLYAVIIYEALKLVMNNLLFRVKTQPVDVKTIFSFLGETRYFMIASVVGFFQSKADLYLLAGSIMKKDLNEYQVVTSLMSLAYIALTSFTAFYSKLLYRQIGDSNKKFFRINIVTGVTLALIFSLGIFILLRLFYNFQFGWLELSLVFLNIFMFSIMLVEMYHYTRLNWVNKSTLLIFLAGLINLSLGYFLINKLSVTGAIISNTASLLVLTAALHFFRKITEKNNGPAL